MIDTLKADMMTARRAKESSKVASYALIISEIEKVGKNDGNRKTTNDEAIALIKKMVIRNEELAGYTEVGPARDKIDAETEMMRKYLPLMITPEAVETFINDLVSGGVSNIGQIMGSLKQEYGQAVDMKAAGGIARNALANA